MVFIETYVVFNVEYRTNTFVNLKVFKLMPASDGHAYDLSDIIQSVISHVSQNFNNITVAEIIKFIGSNLYNIMAVEVVANSNASVGYTVYFDNDNVNLTS